MRLREIKPALLPGVPASEIIRGAYQCPERVMTAEGRPPVTPRGTYFLSCRETRHGDVPGKKGPQWIPVYIDVPEVVLQQLRPHMCDGHVGSFELIHIAEDAEVTLWVKDGMGIAHRPVARWPAEDHSLAALGIEAPWYPELKTDGK